MIRTPIAMIASKGFFGLVDAADWVADLVRSVVDDDRRSVALMPSPAELA